MKKIIVSIMTLATVFSFAFGFTSNIASAAEAHDRYTYADYKKEPIEDHFPYVDGKKVTCTISQWYIRSITKCRTKGHDEELTRSSWAKYDIRHSWGGH